MENTSFTSAIDDLPPHQRKARLGAFYTPRSAADFMAQWLIRGNEEEILEPCYGEGVFLEAISDAAERKSDQSIHLHGVEVDAQAEAKLNEQEIGNVSRLINKSFLKLDPFPVDGVIGNPPYVRLRELSDQEKQHALTVSSQVLGKKMDSSGSTWMPFVLHSMQFLKPGGRMALVLPYDFTYVKYARPLWRELGKKFGHISLLHSFERMFPDVQQDVVILMAEDYGDETNQVEYSTYKSVDEIRTATPLGTSSVSISDVYRGERAFVKSLLDRQTRDLLDNALSSGLLSNKHMKFKIGYVSANKQYFHPDKSTVDEYCIPSSSLRKSIISSKSLSGVGIRTSNIYSDNTSLLFLPDPSSLSDGDKRYIDKGKSDGVHNAYKCKRRNPWYRVPRVDTPDVLLSVFSDVPVAVENDANLAASNSLLCGYVRDSVSVKQVLMGWYTSLLRIQIELEVHSLGGGVMVTIPGEADELQVPYQSQPSQDHLQKVNSLLKECKYESAYMAGDDNVLIDHLNMSKRDVTKIREGVDVLKKWRNSH